MITLNAVLCLNCNTIIHSKHRHDYVTCNCPLGLSVSVDGGEDYKKRSFSENSKWVELYAKPFKG